MSNQSNIVPFGKKYKGQRTDQVPADYLAWCLRQDFVEKDHPEFYEHLLEMEPSIMKELGLDND